MDGLVVNGTIWHEWSNGGWSEATKIKSDHDVRCSAIAESEMKEYMPMTARNWDKMMMKKQASMYFSI